MDLLFEFFRSIPYDQLLIQTVNGIVTGMILALIASGLTLIFGIMDVVNFAHGELFMLGAYVGVVVLATSGSFWLALIIATLVVALLGAALQITTLRPLLGRDPLTTILATFGISHVLLFPSTYEAEFKNPFYEDLRAGNVPDWLTVRYRGERFVWYDVVPEKLAR